jgi:hypothetical protein
VWAVFRTASGRFEVLCTCGSSSRGRLRDDRELRDVQVVLGDLRATHERVDVLRREVLVARLSQYRYVDGNDLLTPLVDVRLTHMDGAALVQIAKANRLKFRVIVARRWPTEA